ncbi:shikimate kinase AroL [Desulfovibrio intestinalis]|uniref:Shikimate kinase n=1 Tax=Desulfovibrio intestinalis TaxID=58621 RepID=A0A7W8C354_9BACT|nr:shikimate kinase AroL [Desulfovibrio intestinalis]MBB5143499.1 shikimate kinase [Desulfovibrio intestinalis]
MPLIFLVGPRACGKTTVGRALAQRLALPFADTDLYLLESTGLTVAQIVALEGWPGFRLRESDALRAIAASHPQGAIVATGGGMVLDEQNRAFMRSQGHVFYLSAPVETLVARLSNNPLTAQRPSLTGGGIADEIRQVLEERLPLYQQTAHHHLDASLHPRRICTLAMEALRALATDAANASQQGMAEFEDEKEEAKAPVFADPQEPRDAHGPDSE